LTTTLVTPGGTSKVSMAPVYVKRRDACGRWFVEIDATRTSSTYAVSGGECVATANATPKRGELISSAVRAHLRAVLQQSHGLVPHHETEPIAMLLHLQRTFVDRL